MKEAVEDHRGSRKERPRNFYGECVPDSDRDFDIHILARRQINTTLKCHTWVKTFVITDVICLLFVMIMASQIQKAPIEKHKILEKAEIKEIKKAYQEKLLCINNKYKQTIKRIKGNNKSGKENRYEKEFY